MLVLALKPHESVLIDFPGRKARLTLLELNEHDIVVELLVNRLTIEATISASVPLMVCLGDMECEVLVSKFRSGKVEIGFNADVDIDIQRARKTIAA